MKKYIFPSLICSIPSFILVVFSFIFYIEFANHKTFSSLVGMGNIVIVFFLLMYFAKKYKLNFKNGIISFGETFGYLFKLSFLWSLIYAILDLILFLLKADLIQKTNEQSIALQKEKMISTMGSMPASSQKLMDEVSSFFSNPYVISVMGLISFLFIGTIMSLIIAAIVKTKPVE